jgi:hypothetical protein
MDLDAKQLDCSLMTKHQKRDVSFADDAVQSANRRAPDSNILGARPGCGRWIGGIIE